MTQLPAHRSSMDLYDYVIVGAGTAGSVLAARLSEDHDCHVLVVEAGRDITPGAAPSDIQSIFPLSTFNGSYTWSDTRVHWRDADHSPAVGMPQGRMVGGTSNIMGMWAMRGMPAVYDGWAAAGAAGWDWESVLPYFRKLETDHDFDGPLHGKGGPIPIRRLPEAQWSPLARAFHLAARQHGYSDIADMNGEPGEGHCVLPISRSQNQRGSAGLCYLTKQVRARANLRVMANSTVTSIEFAPSTEESGLRANGVRIRDALGNYSVVRAKEVILAAGALRSPALLMRSGIGPGDALMAAGVPVRHHLDGVGRNLQNHPMLFMVSFLNRASVEGPGIKPAGNNYLRWSSGVPGLPEGDMGMSVRSWLSWHALGRRMGAVAPTISMPLSRGQVSIHPGQGGAPSINVEFNFLQHPTDLQRMVQGFRLSASMYRQMSHVSGRPYVLQNVTNISRLMRYNEPTRFNAVRARLAAVLMDTAPTLGQKWVSSLARMTPAAEIVDNEERLSEFALGSVSGTGHICGTCRMGKAGDPMAVVDTSGRVMGVRGLRVVDASIMPTVTSGGTHIPVVMIAEKMAEDWRLAITKDSHNRGWTTQ